MVAACLPPWVVAVDGRSPCKTTHLSCGRWRVPLLAVVSTLFFACEPWWISLLTRFSLELYKPRRESRAKRAAMWLLLGCAVRKIGGIHPRNTCDASGNAPAKKKQESELKPPAHKWAPWLGERSGASGIRLLAHSASVTRQSFFRRRFARRSGRSKNRAPFAVHFVFSSPIRLPKVLLCCRRCPRGKGCVGLRVFAVKPHACLERSDWL